MPGNERPAYYQYANLLLTDVTSRRPDFAALDGRPILPRQIEIHVPNDSGTACDLACKHCQGNRIAHQLANVDDAVLGLIADLDGDVPMYVFSGAYVEPTLNPRLVEFVETARGTGSAVGLHTHAGRFVELERELGFVSRLCAATPADDYVTVSLDAATPQSYARTKRVDGSAFDAAVAGVRLLTRERSAQEHGPTVRLTYLMNRWNKSEAELHRAVELAAELGVDTLRFSVPYAPYGTSYANSLRYRDGHETPFYAEVAPLLQRLVSTEHDAVPYVSMLDPGTQDVSDCYRHHCHYGYFQLTIGSDGYVYRCSSTASPSFPSHRLGPVPRTRAEMEEMSGRNQDVTWDPLESCKPLGARCNRAAIEINRTFEDRWFPPSC